MDFDFAPPPLSTVWYDPICAANHCINFSQIALPDMINNSFSNSKLYCWCLSIGHSLKNWVSSFPGFLHWTSKQWFWRRTTHCGNYSLIDVHWLRAAISGSLTFIASPNGSKKTNSLFQPFHVPLHLCSDCQMASDRIQHSRSDFFQKDLLTNKRLRQIKSCALVLQ